MYESSVVAKPEIETSVADSSRDGGSQLLFEAHGALG
jgi:hypothetical protein